MRPNSKADNPSDAAGAVDARRILDASGNRAREGLRVLEDYTRLVLDDAHLSACLKELRHQLAEALGLLRVQELLASRETLRDVGTTISAPGEWDRPGIESVVRSNFARVQEAVRSLEEYGKVLDAAFGRRMEQLRYQSYTLERAVLTTASAVERLEAIRLYVLVHEGGCRLGLEATVRGALAGGAEVIQLREKEVADRAVLGRARSVRQWTREAGVLFIINDRPDLAVLAHADGVHVGQEELSVKDARRIVGPSRLVGVSTHSIEQARQAVLDGADYLGVGPVFASRTKPFDGCAGLELVRQVAGEIRLPAFAIGGIDVENVAAVVQAGARRVAVSASVCGAADPSEAARRLRASLDR
ncbi:MAG: thiamine phosphate synthase [Planctomycetes bacterium]|nr:thiamine phosphate synthase [Planctomycetota bacterium]